MPRNEKKEGPIIKEHVKIADDRHLNLTRVITLRSSILAGVAKTHSRGRREAGEAIRERGGAHTKSQSGNSIEGDF